MTHCWCTKVGVPFCTPLLVHGQSQPRICGHAWRRRGSKDPRLPEHSQARNMKSRRARWTPPERPLPGQPTQPQREPCRSNLPNASRTATLEPKSSDTVNHIGTKAREAPPWWHADLCEDQEHARLDENQKTKIPGKILAEDTHETPGKPLAGDDYNATARPLPGDVYYATFFL